MSDDPQGEVERCSCEHWRHPNDPDGGMCSFCERRQEEFDECTDMIEQQIEMHMCADLVPSALQKVADIQRENEELKLLICGGEDAPGYAASLSVSDMRAVFAERLALAAHRPPAGADTYAQNMRVSAGAGEIEALRTILGILDDPTGGTHVEDMRAASEVARKAIASLTAPAPGVQTEALTFAALREANLQRLPQFKNRKGEPAHSEPDGSDWALSAWSNAVCGELGEAANLIKKIERGDLTLNEARVDLAKEFADVVTYLDILAMRAGVDLGEATIAKFNEVSERVGATVRL